MDKRLVVRRIKKAKKVRSTTQGTTTKPRLSVFRSLNNIYAQLIDDSNSVTLLSVSSKSTDLKEDLAKAKTKTEKSALVGEKLGKLAVEKGIVEATFDRGYYRFHGRVKALADAANKAGLKV